MRLSVLSFMVASEPASSARRTRAQRITLRASYELPCVKCLHAGYLPFASFVDMADRPSRPEHVLRSAALSAQPDSHRNQWAGGISARSALGVWDLSQMCLRVAFRTFFHCSYGILNDVVKRAIRKRPLENPRHAKLFDTEVML